MQSELDEIKRQLRAQRRLTLVTLAALGALATGPLWGTAPTLHTFADGDIATAALVNQNFDALSQAVVNNANGGIPSSEYFLTAGATSWTVPAGVERIFVRVIGAGGSGFGTRDAGELGGGGGGGGVCEKTIDVVPGTSYTITVGEGGYQYSGSEDGGDSSFGTECIATGGDKGTANAGGESGTGTGGDLNYGLGDGRPENLGSWGGGYGVGQRTGFAPGAGGWGNRYPQPFRTAGADGMVLVQY